MDSGDQGSPESLDHGCRKAESAQLGGRRRVVAPEQLAGFGASQPEPQPAEAQLVGEGADRCYRGCDERSRPAERVADDGAPTVVPDVGTGLERAQIEGADIEVAGELWVGGEQHLETAVEHEPVDQIAAYATADSVRCFEDGNRVSGTGDRRRGGQPSQPGPDDHRIGRTIGGEACASNPLG